jgi:hypothetical protein
VLCWTRPNRLIKLIFSHYRLARALETPVLSTESSRHNLLFAARLRINQSVEIEWWKCDFGLRHTIVRQALRSALVHLPRRPSTFSPLTPNTKFMSSSVMYRAVLRIRVLPYPLRRSVFFSRAHHSATGRFITIGSQGTPVTREIEIWLGDPGNSYVMFDPEIGRMFMAGTTLQGGCSLAQDPDLYPLTFYHDTRHFSHGKKFNFYDMASKIDRVLFRIIAIPPPRVTTRSPTPIEREPKFSNSPCLRGDSCDYT